MKLCKDCKHADSDYDCWARDMPRRSPVTGEFRTPNTYQDCFKRRDNDKDACGPEGKLWTPTLWARIKIKLGLLKC